MIERPERDISELFNDERIVGEAMRRAVRRALARHKRLGQPVVVWRDGKVVWLSPEQIPDDEGPEGRE
jgi:hypothetical protein